MSFSLLYPVLFSLQYNTLKMHSNNLHIYYIEIAAMVQAFEFFLVIGSVEIQITDFLKIFFIIYCKFNPLFYKNLLIFFRSLMRII